MPQLSSLVLAGNLTVPLHRSKLISLVPLSSLSTPAPPIVMASPQEQQQQQQQKQPSLQIYSSSNPGVTPYWREKYERDAKKYWDIFYKRHSNKFFKDRHYLEKEWGHYFSFNCDNEDGGKKVVLEVGCGAGNTIFPLVATFPNVLVHACDFSPRAIDLIKAHKDYREDQINAFVSDLTMDNLCNNISPSSVDIVTMVFVLSAVAPEKMALVLDNIRKVLKPNGHLLFRDYAVGDLAQERLIDKDQQISENFYVRGDGTRAFYFSQDFLMSLFKRNGFDTIDIRTYHKQVENRSRELVMNRSGTIGISPMARPSAYKIHGGGISRMDGKSPENYSFPGRWIQAVFCSLDGLSFQSSNIPKPGEKVDDIVQVIESQLHNCFDTSKEYARNNEVDISDSIATEMFGISPSIDEVTETIIDLREHSFRIKGLSKEFQHTCKSTGLILWESARLMSMLLAENPGIVARKTVLELGCGSAGICSMIAASFACLVVATDGDQVALDLLNQNVASNMEPTLLDKLVLRRLEWGNLDHVNAIKEELLNKGVEGGGFDVVIGTDVTYIPDAISPLFDTASALLSRSSSIVPCHSQPKPAAAPALILCHVVRRVDEASIVLAASQCGFRLVDSWPRAVEDAAADPSRSRTGTGIIDSWFSGERNRIVEDTAVNIMYFRRCV